MGSYSIGTAGGVSDIWILFVKLLLEDYPNMFDGIEVQRVGRVFADLDVVLLKPLSLYHLHQRATERRSRDTAQ